MATVVERVRAGAAFLDQQLGPHWPELIDPEQLDISSGCNCVAAQANGRVERDYSNAWAYAMHEWEIVDEEGEIDTERSRALGFLGDADDDDDRLLDEWRALLVERGKYAAEAAS